MTLKISGRAARLLSLSIALSLIACARSDVFIRPTQPPPTETEVPSPSSTAQPQPTETETPAPTSSPTATHTSAPTSTPTATAPPTAQVRLQSSEAGPQYFLPLRIQHVTSSTATLFFELTSPSPGYLLYRQTPASGDIWTYQELDPNAIRHQLTLEGLTDGARYEVQVGLGADLPNLVVPRIRGAAWGPLSLRTPAGDLSRFRVAVLGDSGYGDRETRDLARVLASMAPDFVIHTGDLVYRAWEEDDAPSAFFRKFLLPFESFLARAPVYPVLGNHDLDSETRWKGLPFYFHAFPGFPGEAPTTQPPERTSWYAFSYAGVQFLMLNTQVFFNDAGRQEQLAWLIERLQDPAYDTSVAVFHVPPYTSGLHTEDGLAVRSEWLPIFAEAQVPLIISGHDHNYERLDLDGITAIVSGGGSTVLYGLKERLPQSQRFSQQMHFVLLDFTPTRISISAINLDGETFDRAVIELDAR